MEELVAYQEDQEEFIIEYYDCPICLDEMDDYDYVKWLSCNHAFHTACIKTWFNTNKSVSCPLCRKSGICEDHVLTGEIESVVRKLAYQGNQFSGANTIMDRIAHYVNKSGRHPQLKYYLGLDVRQELEEMIDIRILSLVDKGHLKFKDGLFRYCC